MGIVFQSGMMEPGQIASSGYFKGMICAEPERTLCHINLKAFYYAAIYGFCTEPGRTSPIVL